MKKSLSIIGGGTAGLFLAAFIDSEIYQVTIFEKKKALGRKFLVAGDGGFNLTHGEILANLKNHYSPTSFLDSALTHFTNEDLRAWLLNLGIPTFVGSSGRVFPEKGIKPIEVLKSIQSFLQNKKVKFEFEKTFTSWDKSNGLIFNEKEIIQSDIAVFAMGGGSWKVTGSDGTWLNIFNEKGIKTLPFKSSNCAFNIDWAEKFIQRHEGEPLKNISISINNKTQKGEAVITKSGIEGNAIYALSGEIQAELASKKEAIVYVDFKPTFDLRKVVEKINYSKSNITTTLKEKLKLPKVVVDLLKTTLAKEAFLNIERLANFIKHFPLEIKSAGLIDEAISTTGGIDLHEVKSNFELKKIEDQFCIGEMLDWNAPTGGYLIQACASMGAYLANELNKKEG
jgi:uncharacterized flavoprotein (TIGR03862 family)